MSALPRLAMIVMATLLPAPLATPAASPDPVSFEGALRKLKKHDLVGEVQDLEVLARRGDARAQYLLGVAYLNGEGIARDPSRGYAWLRIATESYEGQFGWTAADEAQDALRQVGPQLSGADMIHADRIAGEFLASNLRELDAASERARRAMTDALQDRASPPDAKSSINGPRPGCALDRTMRNCLKPLQPATSADRCTGSFEPADVKAAEPRISDRIIRGSYPAEASRGGWEGISVLEVHIDRSGDVCQVMLLRSSGFSILDENAMYSAARWQFTPATRSGQPVETMQRSTVAFQLSDYKFK